MPTPSWCWLMPWMSPKPLVLQRNTAGGLGSLLPRADPTREQPHFLRQRLVLPEQRPTALHSSTSLQPSHALRQAQLTLNLKSSWLAEPFMVKDWEMLQGEGSTDGT